MADDIMTRLRHAARACNHGLPNGAGDSFPDPTYCGGCLRLNDAADEIERLRAEVDLKGHRLDDALDEIERLRADIARLGAFLHPIGEQARRD